MKKLLIILLLIPAKYALTQSVGFTVSGGSGMNYIIQYANPNQNVNFGVPTSLLAEIKRTPPDKLWGIKIRLHKLQSTVMAENWMNQFPVLIGTVSSFTSSFLMEKEIFEDSYSYGYHLGIGATKETLHPQQPRLGTSSKIYPSITLGGIFSGRIRNDFYIVLQPDLILHDPLKYINFFDDTDSGEIAGEDISGLIHVGLRYTVNQR